jgi:hypothetical protein
MGSVVAFILFYGGMLAFAFVLYFGLRTIKLI